MFGKNPIRKRELDVERLQVTGIWHTIQGEGPLGGMPATFLRLSGCTLACYFCDTLWDENAPYSTHEEVARTILQTTPVTTRVVVITGGEPLRQPVGRLYEALRELWHQEYNRGLRRWAYPLVQIETSGSVWDHTLDAHLYSFVFDGFERHMTEGLVLVCSPKTPTLNSEIQRLTRHFKYVIQAGATSPDDGLPVMSTQREGHMAVIARPLTWMGISVWVSPCDEYDETKNRANLLAVRDIAMSFGYRVSLQIHKLLGAE